jgi:hypothetical protein
MLRRAPAKKSAKGAQRRCIKGLLDPWLQVIEISGPILKDLTVSNHVESVEKVGFGTDLFAVTTPVVLSARQEVRQR